MWIAAVAGDLALKFLLKTRPYETTAGDADDVFSHSITAFETTMAQPGRTPRQKHKELIAAIERMRDRFRAVPARYVKGRPLIGLVGEIFCRLNTFSNDDVARRIEKFGGECWISDVSEWVWYVNWFVETNTIRQRGRASLKYLKDKIKTHVQHRYERALLRPVAEDCKGYEEPHDIREVLAYAEPYLRPEGSIGEMVLSVGKAIYLYHKGADGIIDISPFTCMNGVICEGVYPAVSAAHNDLPIRNLYFDGINTNVDRDLEIFLDLARAYQRRKQVERIYPDDFGEARRG
jgi:predicted nucleotide-binding protein (sugar kinase/HSP70/actin superfamily)